MSVETIMHTHIHTHTHTHTHPLPPHTHHCRKCIHQPFLCLGGNISVVDSSKPGEQHDAPIAKDLVKKQLQHNSKQQQITTSSVAENVR